MSIWDNRFNPPNIPFKTQGGKTFWENLDYKGGYMLQRNILTKHCRILNAKNVRVSWGKEGPMRAKLLKLAKSPRGDKPQYGDIIGVHRLGPVYDHYGVYENDSCIYEYAAKGHDFGKSDIHITSLEEFLRNSNSFFVLTFPEHYGTPGKYHISGSGTLLSGHGKRVPFKSKEYHLYSPEETIQRAKSRLGEANYSLFTNNCEHFALWCKTGLHESHQIDALLSSLGQIFFNPTSAKK